MQTKVSMIFCTCDGYSDLWENFFFLFQKYWPEFDGEIVFNTESKFFSYEGLSFVYPSEPHKNTAWSDRLYHCLEACNYGKVLIVLEDFYLKAPVKNETFLNTLRAMDQDARIVSIAYQPQPGGYEMCEELPGFEKRRHFSTYTMNASMTLYRKDFLMDMLKSGEDAWEFEVNASFRSWFRKGTFISLIRGQDLVFPYDGSGFVRHGKFIKSVKEYFEEKEGLTFSDKRDVVEEFYDAKKGGSRLYKVMGTSINRSI